MRKKKQERELKDMDDSVAMAGVGLVLREVEEGIEGINGNKNNKIFQGKGDLLNQKITEKRNIKSN